jgi:hypothetical protein
LYPSIDFVYSDTFASQYDSDHEQWDEPLKRRFNPAQTDISKTSTSTQTLMAVPFCRDPTQPVPKLPPEEDRPAGKNVGKDIGNRPAVYKKKTSYSTHNYYQPPVPWSGARDDTEVLENASGKLKKTNYSRSLYGIDAPDMQNPIKELQALAKSTNDMSEDAPPFNFQAMLKKTPRNRASMKRSGESDNNILEDRVPKRLAPTPPLPPSAGRVTPGSAKMTPNRKANPAPRPPSKDLIRKDSKDLIIAALKKRDSKTDLMCAIVDNKLDSEKVELAPGITVEGIVTDL